MPFDVFYAFPQLFVTLCLVLGLVVGSFLNVVIHRLPEILYREWRRESRLILQQEADEAEPSEPPLSLAYPKSHCPKCRSAIPPCHNIPVLSFLMLKGRCAKCKVSIPVQYPLVEAGTGIASALVAWTLGTPELVFAGLAITWCLICLAMIDAGHGLLPDRITLPLLWCGLLLNSSAMFASLNDAVLGAIAGYLSLWLVYWVFKMLTGKEGMGYGDFKLLAALGAWVGWQALLPIVLLSALLGVLVGTVILGVNKKGRSTAIPFGPYLAISGWIVLLWGDLLTRLYFNFLGG